MKQNFSVNDFVWAKLQKYPPWPAIILEPDQQTPNKPTKFLDEHLYWVYFFGTHNYSWIEERHVKDYKQYKDKFVALHKTTSFKESVREIEEYIKKIEEDPSYKVPIKNLIIKNNILTKSTKKRLRVEISELDIIDNLSANPQESKKYKAKDISSDSFRFGIIGIGSTGRRIAKSLVNNSYNINIWDGLSSICDNLQFELGRNSEYFLKCWISPRSVLLNSDIVFICMTDYKIVTAILQNSFRINSADNIINGKGLVKVGGISPENSRDIRDMVENKGGRYLEAQIQEGDPDVCGEKVIILTAGDNSLFVDCQTCFQTFTFKAIYLGDVGYASKLHLILQMIRGVLLSGLSEGLNLAERCGLNQEHFIEIFRGTSLNSRFLKSKIDNILQRNFKTAGHSLQHLQKDVEFGLDISDENQQPMIMATTANQIFKHCVRLGYGNCDPISIHMRNKH